MTYTISLQQLNAVFGLAMPLIVGFVAGMLRQDGFASWLNELISHLVIVILAATQTLLGGQWGGSGIANFVIIVSVAYGVLSTRFGTQFQGKIQTSTSLLKAPPEPPAPAFPSAEEIASVVMRYISQQVRMQVGQVPLDAQPTQQIQAVRTSTPPPSSFQQGG
jgi:hypothetical protein